MFAYLNDGTDPCRYEDQQAGLLVKQIEENDDGAETPPEHYGEHRSEAFNASSLERWRCVLAISRRAFSLPALLDIPTMLFFCFQKLMSFLNARKSKRSWKKNNNN